MDISYPATLPTAAFAELIGVLSSGDLSGNADRGLKAAWIIQGWGQGRIFGDPDTSPLLALSADDEQAIRISAAALFATANRPSTALPSEISGIVLSVIIEQVLDYVLETIRELIERRRVVEG